MTLHEEQERVQRAVEHSLAGMKSDPWLTQRVLARAKGEEPVKKVSAALILVIALMLVTMAVGLAAGTGLLDYLFRGGAKPSARQRDLLQSVNAEHSAKGVSIAVTEALASSGRLSMGFSITADQPVWVHLLDVAVNEEDAPPQDTNALNQFVGDPMSEGSRTVSGGLTCVLSQPIPADAHVKVRLALLVPAGEIVHKSDFSTEEELHKVIGQGKVFLTGDHGEFQVEYDRIAARNDPEQNAIYAQLEPYYALERALTAEETREMKHLESMMYNMADLYVHYGNMKLLDDFTIDFVLNGDMENAIPLNRAESDGTPVHYGVRVEQAFIDAMGFTLRARLYPTGSWTEERIEQAASAFAFYDEERRPLRFQDMWVEKDSGGWQTDESGNRYTEICYRMPALESLPALVYAVPEGTGANAGPLWEDAFVLVPGGTVALRKEAQ